MNNLLDIKGLSAYYTKDKIVLNSCDFTIGQNEVVALVGSNGSGKTTFIKTIMDIHPKYEVSEIGFMGKGSDFKDPYFKENRIAVFQMIQPLGIGVFGNIQNFFTRFMAEKLMKLI